MSKSFMQRRHENPDYELFVYVTGVRCHDNKVHWNVVVEGEDDPEFAADIIDKAIEVLRE